MQRSRLGRLFLFLVDRGIGQRHGLAEFWDLDLLDTLVAAEHIGDLDRAGRLTHRGETEGAADPGGVDGVLGGQDDGDQEQSGHHNRNDYARGNAFSGRRLPSRRRIRGHG